MRVFIAHLFADGAHFFAVRARPANDAPHKHEQQRQQQPHALGIGGKRQCKEDSRSEHAACRALYRIGAVDAVFKEFIHEQEGAHGKESQRRIGKSQPAHHDRRAAEGRERGGEKAVAVAFEQFFAEEVRRGDECGRKERGHDAQAEGALAENEHAQQGQQHRKRAYVCIAREHAVRVEVAEQDMVDLHQRVHLVLREIRIDGAPRAQRILRVDEGRNV